MHFSLSQYVIYGHVQIILPDGKVRGQYIQMGLFKSIGWEKVSMKFEYYIYEKCIHSENDIAFCGFEIWSQYVIFHLKIKFHPRQSI